MDIPRPIPGWKPSTPAVPGGKIASLTQRHPAVAVHFWASWNALDKSMDESVQAIANLFEGRVHFASCNIDLPENLDLCRRSGFANIPAISVFVGDYVSKPIVGCCSPAELTIEIKKRHEKTSLAKPTRRCPWWAFWRA
jgi:thiol-disulfide isomerase/thioredoxin